MLLVELVTDLENLSSEKVILFNLSGHGMMDLLGYDKFLKGELTNYALPDEAIRKYTEPLKDLPKPSMAKSGKW